jgi:hypothetical protein
VALACISMLRFEVLTAVSLKAGEAAWHHIPEDSTLFSSESTLYCEIGGTTK